MQEATAKKDKDVLVFSLNKPTPMEFQDCTNPEDYPEDDRTKKIEAELLEAIRKEMLAIELHKNATEKVKFLKNLLHDEMTKKKREVALPLLQQMISGFDDDKKE